MTETSEIKNEVVVRFAGDSGDGIQLTGSQFTDSTALSGHDLGTYPDFPAEIRAPAGTVPGVSGFQINFGSNAIYTPGDYCDVLVVMNAAAIKSNLKFLKEEGIIIANEDGFDGKNLQSAGYDKADTPLANAEEHYRLYRVPVTKLTREALKDTNLKTKEQDRSKNMFVLGLIYWLFNRDLQPTIDFLEQKFANKPELKQANLNALKAGFNYGETAEIFTTRYEVKPADLPKGSYRSVTGNLATALGLISASQKADLPLFYGSYPITPASDILHELSKHKNFDVRTFQAEDEIGAISAVIGAAYGGSLASTGTSGPGFSLKSEALGLAVNLELPLVVCNIQRAGPSTGMPTKTEQADLLQALYGRHGEAPMPVVAASTPSDCFDMAFEASRLAIEFMTPVIFLSDGYIANGSEPWRFPSSKDLPTIKKMVPEEGQVSDGQFAPYERDDRLVRQWALPGTRGFQNRIGGLEKEKGTGNVSYDPENHQEMVDTRAKKVYKVKDYVPAQTIDNGPQSGDVLLLGWGSTYGVLKSATEQLQYEGYDVAHAQVKYMSPLPRNLEKIVKEFNHVIVPENNNGQFVKVIRNEFLVPAIPFNKVQGIPFTVNEITDKVKTVLKKEGVPG